MFSLVILFELFIRFDFVDSVVCLAGVDLVDLSKYFEGLGLVTLITFQLI